MSEDHRVVILLGYTAGVFTTFGSLPQIIQAIKTKSTKDLSYTSLVIIDVGVTLWAIYGLLVNDYPLVVWDVITCVLYTTLIGIKYYYERESTRISRESHPVNTSEDAETISLVSQK